MNKEYPNKESQETDENKILSMDAYQKKLKEDKHKFQEIIKYYLKSNPYQKTDNKTSELEIRFGSNKMVRSISKFDYDNVVKQLLAAGFISKNIDGVQMLRIASQRDSVNSNVIQMSNIRAEIVGADMIQEYCKTNNLQSLIDLPSYTPNKIKFTKKTPAIIENKKFDPLQMNDFNLSVAFKQEQDFSIQSNVGRDIIRTWTNSKKTFRCMNRVRLYHPDLPINADISIIKSSRTANRFQVPEYTIQDAGVFTNPETYEIELEVDNYYIGQKSEFNNPEKLMDAIRKTIMIVLSGLQNTNFPIAYTEHNNVIQSYMRMIHKDVYEERRVKNKDFIGPQPVTLQMKNLLAKPDGCSAVPSILENYTVTEKADGVRKLLFVNSDGRIYMIDTNMNVYFTGTVTADKTLFMSLVDGEHIKHNKNGENINLYAAFDVYYINNRSMREYAFYNNKTQDNDENQEEKQQDKNNQNQKQENQENNNNQNQEKQSGGAKKDTNNVRPKYRLSILLYFVNKLNHKHVLGKSTDFRIQLKQFYATSDQTTIFDGCRDILAKEEQNLFEYVVDGLIFTPADLPVGGDVPGGKPGPLVKATWEHNFKWKPAKFNTIDFLVTVKKDKTGKDEVSNIVNDGVHADSDVGIVSYKTLVLRCGFNESEDIIMNPFQEMLSDEPPEKKDKTGYNDDYKPVPFQPTNPYDTTACYANIKLTENNRKYGMFTEEGEFFEENMIVEFKYVMEDKEGWKWQPLRVRYDKTAELKAGQKNYGNAFHVANNNWQSIHNPITEEMITTGQDIPNTFMSDDVYYNRMNEENSTQAMRDFHNIFVKHKLIKGVSSPNDTLIDFAVGKAGDLPKWISAKLKFVFGIDISKDNIHNKKDGACARYLKMCNRFPRRLKAVFVTGNCGLNVRNGAAFNTEQERIITKALFRLGPRDERVIGKAVANQYGVAETGFNVCSCQFAIHYFFENTRTLHNFMRNVAECTKMNGYFISTCYDGKSIFDLLSKKEKGESVSIFKGSNNEIKESGNKIFEITKMYDQTGFPDDEMSVGYSINVYQDSINKEFREYLVNFNYLVRLMDNYGFVLASKEDMVSINLPSSSGMFSELFNEMENEVESKRVPSANYKNAMNMSEEEKRISFLNRYFIFKKVRTVDVAKLQEIMALQEKLIQENGEEGVAEMADQIDTSNPISNIRKTPRKIKIKAFTPVAESVPVEDKEEDKDKDKNNEEEQDKEPEQEKQEPEQEEEVPAPVVKPKIKIKIKDTPIVAPVEKPKIKIKIKDTPKIDDIEEVNVLPDSDEPPIELKKKKKDKKDKKNKDKKDKDNEKKDNKDKTDKKKNKDKE